MDCLLEVSEVGGCWGALSDGLPTLIASRQGSIADRENQNSKLALLAINKPPYRALFGAADPGCLVQVLRLACLPSQLQDRRRLRWAHCRSCSLVRKPPVQLEAFPEWARKPEAITRLQRLLKLVRLASACLRVSPTLPGAGRPSGGSDDRYRPRNSGHHSHGTPGCLSSWLSAHSATSRQCQDRSALEHRRLLQIIQPHIAKHFHGFTSTLEWLLLELRAFDVARDFALCAGAYLAQIGPGVKGIIKNPLVAILKDGLLASRADLTEASLAEVRCFFRNGQLANLCTIIAPSLCLSFSLPALSRPSCPRCATSWHCTALRTM